MLGISRKKTTLFSSEFFDLIFTLNFVYASQFVFYVVVYTKTIRQLGLVVELLNRNTGCLSFRPNNARVFKRLFYKYIYIYIYIYYSFYFKKVATTACFIREESSGG